MLQAPHAPPSSSPTQPAEHTFALRDGTKLFYRAWLPAGATDRALVLFHRGHEHSGRWQETVEALGLGDVAVFAWDARGHGRSGSARESSLAATVKDADEFMRHLSERYQIAPGNVVVLGHSLGAVTAAAWVHDYAPPIRGLILATPAFRTRLYVPFALPILRLRRKLFGPGHVTSYVRAGMLTHDPTQAERYRSDELISSRIDLDLLLDLHDTSTRLLADAGALTVPTLVLAAGSDWVVRTSPPRRFVERLSSSIKRFEVLPGFRHSIFHEKERHLVVARVRDFIRELFGHPRDNASLANADMQGYTKAEYDRHCRPGGLRFAPVRWLLKSVGRLSRGITVSLRHGFDSGVMLDYVYENRPRGVTPLGRLIDRGYLNSIGWRGIRVRRSHLEEALQSTIERMHAAGRPVRLLDIASGPGRYVLETMKRLGHIPMTALLRDYKPENLQSARRLAHEFRPGGVTIVHGDAFDAESLAAVMPRPTIAVVSGLYELFPDNEPVRRSLRGLAEAVEPGGFLIYTNQPWHSQVEFIARVLTNREGRPWIMRRRTQAEMDELVRLAGFEKIDQTIDPWGIFTVSVARRVMA